MNLIWILIFCCSVICILIKQTPLHVHCCSDDRIIGNRPPRPSTRILKVGFYPRPVWLSDSFTLFKKKKKKPVSRGPSCKENIYMFHSGEKFIPLSVCPHSVLCRNADLPWLARFWEQFEKVRGAWHAHSTHTDDGGGGVLEEAKAEKRQTILEALVFSLPVPDTLVGDHSDSPLACCLAAASNIKAIGAVSLLHAPVMILMMWVLERQQQLRPGPLPSHGWMWSREKETTRKYLWLRVTRDRGAWHLPGDIYASRRVTRPPDLTVAHHTTPGMWHNKFAVWFSNAICVCLLGY